MRIARVKCHLFGVALTIKLKQILRLPLLQLQPWPWPWPCPELSHHWSYYYLTVTLPPALKLTRMLTMTLSLTLTQTLTPSMLRGQAHTSWPLCGSPSASMIQPHPHDSNLVSQGGWFHPFVACHLTEFWPFGASGRPYPIIYIASIWYMSEGSAVEMPPPWLGSQEEICANGVPNPGLQHWEIR